MAELFKNIYWADIGQACLETLSMLSAALGFTVLLGLPLGVLLFLTGKRQLHETLVVYRALALMKPPWPWARRSLWDDRAATNADCC